MAKRSKGPGRKAQNVHATIREHAAALNATPGFGVCDADEFPELAALLTASRAAVGAGVPRIVFFKGRNYWLRVRLAVQLDIYEQPGDALPLVQGMSFSTEDHGHAPGY